MSNALADFLTALSTPEWWASRYRAEAAGYCTRCFDVGRKTTPAIGWSMPPAGREREGRALTCERCHEELHARFGYHREGEQR